MNDTLTDKHDAYFSEVHKLDSVQWEKHPIARYPARGQATRDLRYAVKRRK